MHEFTLVLSGAHELTPEIEDALFEGGMDDALLGIRDGVPFLDFDREAPTLLDAVVDAIRSVESAGAGLTVLRMEPDELVNTPDIAERIGRTRESVRLLVAGQRGPGGFPAPVRGISSRNRLWRWSEVARWLSDAVPGSVTTEQVEQAQTISAVNAALQLRRNAIEGAGGILARLAG